MIEFTRPVGGSGRHHYAYARFHAGHARVRPQMAVSSPPVLLPAAVPGTDQPYAGMDPSNPLTYVRPWNPAPGMIAQLNYDGSQVQARQPTGGFQNGLKQRKRGYR